MSKIRSPLGLVRGRRERHRPDGLRRRAAARTRSPATRPRPPLRLRRQPDTTPTPTPTSYEVTALVSDQAGVAITQDPNPWRLGISFGPGQCGLRRTP